MQRMLLFDLLRHVLAACCSAPPAEQHGPEAGPVVAKSGAWGRRARKRCKAPSPP